MRAELGGVGDGWRGIRRRLGAPPRPPSLRELAAGPGRAAPRRLRPRSRRGPKERSPAAGRGAAAPPPPPGPAFGCCGAALRCLLTSALCFFFPPQTARLTPLWALPRARIMPDQITVSEFIAETTEDYNSPTTSSFTTRLQNCRNTVTLLEEVRSALFVPFSLR